MKRLMAVAGCLLLIVGSASADVTLGLSEGAWTNPVGGTSPTWLFDQDAGGYGNNESDQIWWGLDVGNGQSGLGFTGAAPPPATFDLGDTFEVGKLEHFNNPIEFGTHATAVDLTVSLTFDDPAGVSGDFTFTLLIDETLNDPGPVDDIISFLTTTSSQTILVGGKLYTLEILGFGDDPGNLTDQFVSPEGTTNDTKLWARITEAEITIDIKPGSFPNSINLKNKGVIPVAILTTEGFDACTVDPTTVRFGPADAEPVQWACEDVDGDGDCDMIFHFRTQETGIQPGDTEATLTGQTTGGINIVASDSVRTVPPK